MGQKLSFNDFTIDSIHEVNDANAQGCIHKICEITNKKEKKKYSMKAFPIESKNCDKNEYQRDEKIMSKLNHANIAKFVGSFEETKKGKYIQKIIYSFYFIEIHAKNYFVYIEIFPGMNAFCIVMEHWESSLEEFIESTEIYMDEDHVMINDYKIFLLFM